MKEWLGGVIPVFCSDGQSALTIASCVGPRLLMASSTLDELHRALWDCFDDPSFRAARCLCLGNRSGLEDVIGSTLDPQALEDLPLCVELLKAQRSLSLDARGLKEGDEFITELVMDFCTPSTLKASFSAGVRGDALLFTLLYMNKHAIQLPLQAQRNIMSMLRRTLEDGTRLLLGVFPESLTNLHMEPLDLDDLMGQAKQTEQGFQRMVAAAKEQGVGPYCPFGPPLD